MSSAEAFPIKESDYTSRVLSMSDRLSIGLAQNAEPMFDVQLKVR